METLLEGKKLYSDLEEYQPPPYFSASRLKEGGGDVSASVKT
jgi:hypothetical protein